MGRWGSGLFQSDSDYDICDFISDQAGVEVYQYWNTEGPDARGVGLEATCKKLNNGTLNRLFDKFKSNKKNGTGYSNKYCMVILGALAMRVGGRIRDEDMMTLEHIYKNSGLGGKALPQFEKALKEYKNDGTPIELDSAGLMETMNRVVDGSEKQEFGTTIFTMPNSKEKPMSETKTAPADPHSGEFGDNFMANLRNAMKGLTSASSADTPTTSDKPKASKKAKNSDKTKENKPNGASHADDKLDDEEFERRMKAALPNALAYVNSEGMKWEGLDEE